MIGPEDKNTNTKTCAHNFDKLVLKRDKMLHEKWRIATGIVKL